MFVDKVHQFFIQFYMQCYSLDADYTVKIRTCRILIGKVCYYSPYFYCHAMAWVIVATGGKQCCPPYMASFFYERWYMYTYIYIHIYVTIRKYPVIYIYIYISIFIFNTMADSKTINIEALMWIHYIKLHDWSHSIIAIFVKQMDRIIYIYIYIYTVLHLP